MMRAIPQTALDFLDKHEGNILRVYDDANPNKVLKPGDTVIGVLSAGRGHTGGLHIGQQVLPAKSYAWLLEDAETAGRRLAMVVSQDVIDALSDGQYSALIAFVFNIGANPTWTIWKRLNNRQFDLVPTEMRRFVYQTIAGKPVKVQGLVNRREAEIALWNSASA